MRGSLRYIALGAIIAAVMVTAVITVFQRQEMSRVMETGKIHNDAVARLFANTLWVRFASYLQGIDDTDPETLRARPETHELRRAVDALIRGTPVLRVNIYNRDGILVFSTEPSLIGVDDSAHGHFLEARQGHVVSGLSLRGLDLDPETEDSGAGRNILESYVPMGGADGTVDVVFTLYFDATDQLSRPRQGADCALCTLYDRVCTKIQDLLAKPSVCAPFYL